MSFIDTKRVIKSGWINFKRNGMVSAAAVLVMTITLSVITGLIFLQAILNSSLTQIESKVDIAIYFPTSTSESTIITTKASLEKLPEVSGVTYTSSEDSIAQFRDRHKDDYLTIQALDELDQNPLGASLSVKAKDSAQYGAIAKFIKSDSGIAKSDTNIVDNYDKNQLVIERLNAIIAGGKTLGFLVTLVLFIISIVITFNTIRLTIFISREEIGVMRLVGAANKYIRGPFMVEGVIYGLIASLITLGVFFPITMWFGHNVTMSGFLGINLFEYYQTNFLQILSLTLISGVFLGVVSSLFAIHKYLNK
jgi:cell division transport system permease protein